MSVTIKMSNFERIYQIDPLRESPEQRENHLYIELSDSEHLERNGFVRTGHIDLTPSEAPKIPMKLEIPELEKSIKKGKKNAKSKSKSTARRTKKDNPKSNSAAVEKIQDKL